MNSDAGVSAGFPRIGDRAVGVRGDAGGGLAVRPLAAVIPALLGGVLVTALFTMMAFGWNSNMTGGYGGWAILQTCAYAPLVLWGPLLFLVIGHCVRRRGLRLSAGR